MTTQVTTAQKNELAMPTQSFGFENILSEDIRIPRLLLVQQMSAMATDDKINARPGEIRESFEGRLMGSKDKPIQMIPFYTTNSWTVSKFVNGKWEFHGVVERTAKDSNRPYEEMVDAEQYKNERTLNIFTLIRGENLSVPYMISMRGSSLKLAGNKFLSMGALIRAEGESYANRVFNLTSQVVENDKGKFYAYSVEALTDKQGKKEKSTTEEYTSAYQAYLIISKSLQSGASVTNGALSE